jgi:hypothetical protein
VHAKLCGYHLIESRVIPDWKKFISSDENIIRFLGDYIAKHIRQNSSLQEGQSLYLVGLFSNPETVKMLDCSCLASTQECKLKTRDLIFYKIKCHLTKGSKPFCIY